MARILGVSAYYHDSAAALVVDGNVVAAAQEERFTRKKHDHAFPSRAAEYCLSKSGLRDANELDYVVFYDKPILKFDRLLETYVAYAPSGLRSFIKAMPLWLKKKLWMKDDIAEQLDYDGEILFTEHHESHAASAFYPSPFEEAAILTMDGVGEWATSSIGFGRANELQITQEIHFPHSLGLLYSAFTYFCGFKVNSGEYKLMGLAPYGEPKYVDVIERELIDVKDDGSFKLNMTYFNYCAGLTMTNRRFAKLFDGAPRKKETKITQREMDLAASVQVVTERVMLKMARHAQKLTGSKNLVMAGGVALNCVGNGKLLRDGTYDNIWIQPAAGDAGGALGAALFAEYALLGGQRTATSRDRQYASRLGPNFERSAIESFIDQNKIVAEGCVDIDELCAKVAELLDAQHVVGWFQGRMEFGPRALGSRSIIGDPRSAEMQSKMNLKIKFRESFRPFAPSVLREHAAEYFEIDAESPYMLLVADVAESKRNPEAPADAVGLDKLKVVRSEVPAITHVDNSARIQTVTAEDDERYYKLIKAFHERTGCPVIVNTSFNVRGEPIVCTPEDAYRCFLRTNMDTLVLGDYVIEKSKQPDLPPIEDDWQNEFELD